MPEDLITYEQPLNERIRTFMRLEHLFHQAFHNLRGSSIWASRQTLTGIIDVLSILERSDLKTEILKELERHTSNLARLEQTPGVDLDKLNRILGEIETLLDDFYRHGGRLGQGLRENEFIAAIRQRITIAGGTCDFDLPLYHHWLERPAEDRIRQLEAWLTEFEPVYEAVSLILRLIRQSAAPMDMVAEKGFFQKALDANVPFQMVQVALPVESPLYPEISAGKHRFTIRFMEAALNGRPAQTGEDVPFELTYCMI